MKTGHRFAYISESRAGKRGSKRMVQSRLGLFAAFSFLFVLALSFASAADPGHSAGAVGPGTFEAGNYVFPNNVTINEFVGIGTSSPQTALDVVSTSLDPLKLRRANGLGNLTITIDNVFNSSSSDAVFVARPDSGRLGGFAFRPSGTGANYALMITYNGRVGIGTSTPSRELDVRGIGNFSGTVYVNNGTDILTYIGQNVSASSYWNLSGSNLFPSSLNSNIGIGTNNPAYKLDVRGNASLNNTLFVTASGNVGIGVSNPQKTLEVNGVQDFNGEGIPGTYSYNSTNSLGGTAGFPSMTRGIVQTVNTDFSLWTQRNYGSDYSEGVIAFGDDANSALSFEYWAWNGSGTSAPVPVLYLKPTGNVGVGTVTPSQRLDVRGIGNFSGTVYLNNNTDILALVNSINTSSSAADDWNISGINLFPKSLSYNVGIGTVAPLSRLQVVGSANYDASLFNESTSTFSVGPSGGYALTMSQSTASPYAFWLQVRHSVANNTAGPLSLNPLGGNVGIGTTTPSRALDVRGIGNFSGTVYVNNNTDVLSLISAVNSTTGWNISGASLFPSSLNSNIGIGTNAPGYKLEINAATNALNVSNNLFVNGTTVGIGAKTTKAILEVNSTAASTYRFLVANASGYRLFSIDNTGNVVFSDQIPTINFANANTIGFNDIDIGDPGANEGYGWTGTAANWVIDVSPPDRSNNDGDLNLYGSSALYNVSVWRPLNIRYNATISNRLQTESSGVLTFLGANNISAGGSIITNLGTPLAGTDAATKAYVDSVTGGTGNSTGTYVPYTGANSNVNLGVYNLTTTGRVGIGTSSPSDVLDVVGDAKVSGNVYSSKITVDPTSGAGWYRIATVSGNTGGTAYLIALIDNRIQRLEFNYNMRSYVNTNQSVGQITILRQFNYNNGPVSKIRIGAESVTGNYTTFLDIYVNTATVPAAFTIYGTNGAQFLSSPIASASAPTYFKELDVATTAYYGIATTDTIYTNGSLLLQGNLGVGTANPSRALDVRGIGNFSGDVYINNGTSLNTNLTSIISALNSVNTSSSAADDWNLTGSFLYPKSLAYSIGVGTNSPGEKLTVYGGNISLTGADSAGGIIFTRGKGINLTNTQGGIWFQHNGGLAGNDEALIFDIGDPSYDYRFKSNRTDILVLNGNGNIGVGSSNPQARFVANATAGVVGQFISHNGGSIENIELINTENNGLYEFRVGGSGSSIGSGSLAITNNGAARNYLVIRNDTGNVGIGTATPSQALDVRGAGNFSGDVYINNGTSLNTNLTSIISALNSVNSSSSVADDWNLSSGVLYPKDLNYNLSIGTTAQVGKLNVYNGVPDAYNTIAQFTSNRNSNIYLTLANLNFSATPVYGLFANANGHFGVHRLGYSDILTFENDADVLFQDDLIIKNVTGNVGIGTSGPAAKLDVNGSIILNNSLLFRNSIGQSSSSIRMDSSYGTSNGLIIDNPTDGAIVLNSYVNGYIAFRVNNSERFRIGNTGNLSTTNGWITNLNNPLAPQDAATKAYVDAINTSSSAADDWNLSGGNLYPRDLNYNFSVGTTNPGNYRFYVSGPSTPVPLSPSYIGVFDGSVDGRSLVLSYNRQSNPTAQASHVGFAGRAYDFNSSMPIEFQLMVHGRTNTGTFGETILSVPQDFVIYTANEFVNTNSSNYSSYGSHALTVKNGTGFVGIGTNSPSQKLDVRGIGNFSGDVYINNGTSLNNNLTLIISSLNSINTSSSAADDWNLSGTNLFPKALNYNVGIGTITPGAQLEINSSNTGSLLIRGDAVSGPARQAVISLVSTTNENRARGIIISNNTADQWFVGAPYSADAFMIGRNASRPEYPANSIFYINNAGNVGIGTIAPSAKLEVNGSTVLQDSGANVLTIKATSTNHPLYIQDASGNITARIINGGNLILRGHGTTDMVDISPNGNTYFNGGNVGIGTATPSRALDVRGIGNFSGTVYVNNGTDVLSLINAVNSTTGWNISGTNLFPSSLASNVGIGTNSPGRTLDVFGTARVTQTFELLNNGNSSTPLVVYDGIQNAIFRLFGNATTNASIIMRDTGGNNKLSLAVAGNSYLGGGGLAVNTTTQTSTLEVKGTFNSSVNGGGAALTQSGDFKIGI